MDPGWARYYDLEKETVQCFSLANWMDTGPVDELSDLLVPNIDDWGERKDLVWHEKSPFVDAARDRAAARIAKKKRQRIEEIIRQFEHIRY